MFGTGRELACLCQQSVYYSWTTPCGTDTGPDHLLEPEPCSNPCNSLLRLANKFKPAFARPQLGRVCDVSSCARGNTPARAAWERSFRDWASSYWLLGSDVSFFYYEKEPRLGEGQALLHAALHFPKS